MKKIIIILLYTGIVYGQANISETTFGVFNNLLLNEELNLTGGQAGYRFGNIKNKLRGAFTPREENKNTLYASGVASFNTLKIYGRFKAQNLNPLDLPFSSIANPYNDSPFMWLDTNGGNWLKQHLLARTILTYEASSFFQAAVGINYLVGQGNRRNDPKPLYRRNFVVVKPSVLITPLPNNSIGFFYGYMRGVEEDEFGYNTTKFSQLIRLRGLNLFETTSLSSADRKLEQEIETYGFNYVFKTQSLLIKSEFSSTARKDTLFEGVAEPRSTGKFYQREKKITASLNWMPEQFSLSLLLTYLTVEGKGFDPVFEAFNTVTNEKEGTIDAILQYTGFKSFNKIECKAGFLSSYLRQREFYSGVDYYINKNKLTLALAGSFNISEKVITSLGFGYDFPIGLSNSYVIELPLKYAEEITEKEFNLLKAKCNEYAVSFSFDFSELFEGIQKIRTGIEFIRKQETHELKRYDTQINFSTTIYY